MTNRWDETWHRLREWTNGQALSERLAAQILFHEGYEDLDPSHPLGGKDGKKDAICKKDGQYWVMAVYFPRGQQNFNDIRKKLLNDLQGVEPNGANALAFVTNQELSLAERQNLKKAAGEISLELFHRERITAILDQPKMHGIRKQFLRIDFTDESTHTANTLLNQYIDTAWILFSKFERLAYKMADGTQNDSLGTRIQQEINELVWQLRLLLQRINSGESDLDQSLREKATAIYNTLTDKHGSPETLRIAISQLLEAMERTA